MPELDSGLVIQVDVENDAKSCFEIVVISKSFGRRKQDAVVTAFPQQSLYTPEHPGVIIDDKDDVSIWQ